jgi:hypothetical protein
MQVRNSSLPYEAIVRQAGAGRARKYAEAIAPLFVAIFQAIDRVAAAIVGSLRATSPDDEYLAGAWQPRRTAAALPRSRATALSRGAGGRALAQPQFGVARIGVSRRELS